MALTTNTGITNNEYMKDRTPEVEVRIDSEGKGYLFRKDKIIKEEIIEEVEKKPKLKSKSLRGYKK